MMFPTSQAQQDPLPRVVLVELRAMLILGTFSSVGLKHLPVLQQGQEPLWLGTSPVSSLKAFGTASFMPPCLRHQA